MPYSDDAPDIDTLTVDELIDLINGGRGVSWGEDGQVLLHLVIRLAGPFAWMYRISKTHQDEILDWVRKSVGAQMAEYASNNKWDLPLLSWFVKAGVKYALTGSLRNAFD